MEKVMGGVLSKEIFTVTDLQGPLADKQISDLVNLIKVDRDLKQGYIAFVHILLETYPVMWVGIALLVKIAL